MAIVNQSLARQMWGREDVIGESIALVSTFGTETAHVVGVSKRRAARGPIRLTRGLDLPSALATP